MQNLTLYVAAGETVGTVRDYANALNASFPTLMRGVACSIYMRLFKSLESDQAYPIERFSDVTRWEFLVDNDFVDTTTPKIVADEGRITVHSITETIDGEQRTMTEFVIPVSNMNSTALATLIGTQKSVSGLIGELCGYNSGGSLVFCLQIEGMTVRNRISPAGEPIPLVSAMAADTAITAFAVYPNSTAIAAGTAAPWDSTRTLTNAIPAGRMTEKFVLRTITPDQTKSDVVIDWGDNTIEALKNVTFIAASKSATNTTLYTSGSGSTDYSKHQKCEFQNGDAYYMLSHTYATAGRYEVRVTGRGYHNLMHFTRDYFVDPATGSFFETNDVHAGKYSLLCECLTWNLPLAAQISNLTGFACGCQRLLSLNVPYGIFRGITNFSNSFSYCKNLKKASGFGGLGALVRHLNFIFANDTAMTECDLVFPHLMESAPWALNMCSSLVREVADFFPERGFEGNRIAFWCTFRGCSSLTCVNGVPADKLWGSHHTEWLLTSSGAYPPFSDCSAAVRALVPSANGWGGTNASLKPYDFNDVGGNRAILDPVAVTGGSVTLTSAGRLYKIPVAGSPVTITVNTANVSAGQVARFEMEFPVTASAGVTFPSNWTWEGECPVFSSGTVLVDVFYDGTSFGARRTFTVIPPPPTGVFVYEGTGELYESAMSFDELSIENNWYAEVYSGGTVTTLNVSADGSATISGGTVTTLSANGEGCAIQIGGGTIGAMAVVDIDSTCICGGTISALSGGNTNMLISGGGVVISSMDISGGTVLTSSAPCIKSCVVSSGKMYVSQAMVMDYLGTFGAGHAIVRGGIPTISSATVSGTMEVHQGKLSRVSIEGGGNLSVYADNGNCIIGTIDFPDGGMAVLNASGSGTTDTKKISVESIHVDYDGEVIISATNPRGTQWAVVVNTLEVGENGGVNSASIASGTVSNLRASFGVVTCQNAGIISGGRVSNAVLFGSSGGTIQNVAVCSGGTVNVSGGCTTLNITNSGGTFISGGTTVF